MSASKKGNLAFLFILLAYLVYAGVFILRSSFVVGGERYFVLFDDAMISMRYAENLADGYGPVWNPGEERVEGYTNPLWVVWMALFHLLPIPASKVSLLVQISGAVFMLGGLFYLRKIALEVTKSELVGLLAVLLTAFYMPLINWTLLGMEVSLLVFLVNASAYLLLRAWRAKRFSVWPYLLLGLGTLVRLDMAVPFLFSIGFMAWVDPGNRRKHLLWGLGVLVGLLGVQTLFRIWYYHDPLPNTYYLKVSGYSMFLRIARGLYALYTFIWSSNWVLLILPFTLFVFRRDPEMFFLFGLVLAQAAYSAYVGGDAWEHRGGSNRYLSLAIPIFFLLFSYAVSTLINALAGFLKGSPRRIAAWSSVVLVLFTIFSMVNFNYLLGKNKSLERWLLIAQPMFSQGNQEYVEIAIDLEKITTPQAQIAVVAAGTTPYFTKRPAIDLLGKSDRVIAHQEAHNVGSWTNLEEFRPGHTKWDYEYSIGQLKPDVIVQLWGDTRPAEVYLERDYVAGGSGSGLVFYLRKDSAAILWDRVQLSQ